MGTRGVVDPSLMDCTEYNVNPRMYNQMEKREVHGGRRKRRLYSWTYKKYITIKKLWTRDYPETLQTTSTLQNRITVSFKVLIFNKTIQKLFSVKKNTLV